MNLDPRSPGRFLGLAVAAPYAEVIARARNRYGLPLNVTLALAAALLLILAWMIAVSRRRDRPGGGAVLAGDRFAEGLGRQRSAKREAQ
jgi:hypothetical protein